MAGRSATNPCLKEGALSRLRQRGFTGDLVLPEVTKGARAGTDVGRVAVAAADGYRDAASSEPPGIDAALRRMQVTLVESDRLFEILVGRFGG
jgi:hypothetical protein